MKYNLDDPKYRFAARKRQLLKRLLFRKGLSVTKRLQCSLAFLQAEGDWMNLSGILDLFITGKQNFGKAYEVLLQGYLFCGYPRAIESFFCLKEILDKKDMDFSDKIEYRSLRDSAHLIKSGESLSGKVHGGKIRNIRDKIDDICPDLGYLMIAEGYGHVLCRGGLDLKSRELAVVASLTALRAKRQLHSHIRGARNVGCSDPGIFEAIVTGLAWVKPRKVKEAIELWSFVTGRESPDSIDNIISSRV
jgi:4-carboxymuconolactone decarboxylase